MRIRLTLDITRSQPAEPMERDTDMGAQVEAAHPAPIGFTANTTDMEEREP